MNALRVELLRLAIAVAAVATAIGGGPAARAAAPDSFLLGTSARTGDICEALADDNDPTAQRKGAHAWTVRCRGWNYDFGRLYAFTNGGGDALRDGGALNVALARRANCGPAKPAKVTGLDGATKRACKATSGSGANYVAYQARAPHLLEPTVFVAADGQEPISDLLEAGLKIVAGKVTNTVAASDTGGDEAEAVDPNALATSVLRMAYVDNQRWQFADAERGFRASARDQKASPEARAEAYLNWALNASNTGRFTEADDRFKDAANLAEALHDKALDALALNYQAMHQRNQLHFPEAIKAAQDAIALRASTAKAETVATAKPGEIRIDEGLSTAFNHGAQRETLQTLTDDQKSAVRDAQAWYIIASAQESLGQRDQALASLNHAERIFTNQASLTGSEVLISSTGWLRAQILAEGAQVDLASSHGPEAVAAATAALDALRKQPELRGTATEAAFILTLAQSEAVAKQTESAMRDYAEGFKLFRDTRGSLGGSADAAEVYFDLLIQQSKSDPAHAADYEARYFDAMQSVVDPTTAATQKKLFARISSGDGATAGLARSFEDTGRLLAIANGTVKTLQDEGKYAGVEKERADAQVATLRAQQQNLQQQLLAANPHYNAIIHTAATIPSLQAALSGDEIYVKYLILSSRSYGLAITKDRVVTYAIPLSADEAAQTVKRLRTAFDTVDRLPRFDVAGAHDLYVKLFGPVADTVAKSHHLIYEPDGVLISVPAGILVTDQASADGYKQRLGPYRQGADIDLYQNVSWLGRKSDISLEVSASGFILSRKAGPSQGAKPFIAFGDPITEGVTDPRLFSLLINEDQGRPKDRCEPERLDMSMQLQRLKGADQAIRDIGAELKASPDDLVLGQAYTDVAVKARKDLDQYRVVFFGTHGLLPVEGDCLPEPALVTSLGVGDSDALLSVSDIFELHLDSAELVVLSACDTGGGNTASARTGVTGSGAALEGLANAFIAAGARNLVVSHWQIPETSNQLIMTSVFRPGSGDQAEALRRAQLQLMDNKAYSHPFYWAAFSLVGDGARPFPGS